MSKIIEEVPLIQGPTGPPKDTLTALFIVHVLTLITIGCHWLHHTANILVQIFRRRGLAHPLPESLTMPQATTKLALVETPFRPSINASTIGFPVHVIAVIGVPIRELLDSIAMFHEIHEIALIVRSVRVRDLPWSSGLAHTPFPFVSNSDPITPDPNTMLSTVRPHSIIAFLWARELSLPFWFSVHEATIIQVTIAEWFLSIAMFLIVLPFTTIYRFPCSWIHYQHSQTVPCFVKKFSKVKTLLVVLESRRLAFLLSPYQPLRIESCIHDLNTRSREIIKCHYVNVIKVFLTQFLMLGKLLFF